MLLLFFSLRFYLFIFRERGREEEKHQCVVASHVPPTGDLTWPATQACAMTENRTYDPLVCRLALKPLSHTSQGMLFLDIFSTTEVACASVSSSVKPHRIVEKSTWRVVLKCSDRYLVLSRALVQ